MNEPKSISCTRCGKPFPATSGRAKYCGAPCRNASMRDRNVMTYTPPCRPVDSELEALMRAGGPRYDEVRYSPIRKCLRCSRPGDRDEIQYGSYWLGWIKGQKKSGQKHKIEGVFCRSCDAELSKLAEAKDDTRLVEGLIKQFRRQANGGY